jgi:hypothetical protein
VLVEKVEENRDHSERSVLAGPLLQLFKHGFQEAREEIGSRFVHVLELRGTLEFSLDLKVHVIIEAIECVALENSIFDKLRSQTFLSVLKHVLGAYTLASIGIFIVLLCSLVYLLLIVFR